MKATVGVLTSGGDCSGMNAAIKSIVEEASTYRFKIKGIFEGYKGLIENKIKDLNYKNVAGILQRGGTFLMSSRAPEFKEEEGFKRALKTIERNKLDAIIVIGGDGSLRGAKKLYEAGVQVIGIPGSIDNDIYGTDMSIGVDTALNQIARSIDTIRDTASSHRRAFVIETMGRESGYLAAMGAIAGGAEAVLIPEVKFDIDSIAERLKREHDKGRMYSIVVVAEGVNKTNEIAQTLREKANLDTRITVLGHLQRGGSPSAFDRTLGMRMGTTAIEAIHNRRSGYMVGLSGNRMELVSFDAVFTNKKTLAEKVLEFVKAKSK